LARRKIRTGKQVDKDTRADSKIVSAMRDRKGSSIPPSDAPPETQRWQVAMFDLPRELKAELDTKIIVVQTLLNQVDNRIARMQRMQVGQPSEPEPSLRRPIRELRTRGHQATEIATQMGLPLSDVELTIASL